MPELKRVNSREWPAGTQLCWTVRVFLDGRTRQKILNELGVPAKDSPVRRPWHHHDAGCLDHVQKFAPRRHLTDDQPGWPSPQTTWPCARWSMSATRAEDSGGSADGATLNKLMRDTHKMPRNQPLLNIRRNLRKMPRNGSGGVLLACRSEAEHLAEDGQPEPLPIRANA